VRMDAPASYFRIAAELSGIIIALQVDGEHFGAEVRLGATVRLIDAPENQDALVITSRAAILEILDGRLLLLDAVLACKLTLQAEVNLLAHIARASQTFSEGALRSRRARALFDELRLAWA